MRFAAIGLFVTSIAVAQIRIGIPGTSYPGGQRRQGGGRNGDSNKQTQNHIDGRVVTGDDIPVSGVTVALGRPGKAAADASDSRPKLERPHDPPPSKDPAPETAAAPAATIDDTDYFKTIYTDHDGTFRFTGLQPGTYIVSVTRDGFTSAKQTVRLTRNGSNSTLVINIARTLDSKSPTDAPAPRRRATDGSTSSTPAEIHPRTERQ